MTFLNDNNHGVTSGLPTSANNGLFYIAIGFSVGGFEVVKELLSTLVTTSNNFSVFLSQPLEDAQISALATMQFVNPLLQIHRVAEGETIEPGLIYTPMPGNVLQVKGNMIMPHNCKEAGDGFVADTLFLSVGTSVAQKCIAVVLSGMGNDGAAGVKSIKAVGGKVLVQRPETSKYDGMPKAAIATGCAHAIVNPAEIGNMIAEMINQQSLSLNGNAGINPGPLQPMAKLVVMNAPVVSIEHMVKESLYAGYEHTYIIIDSKHNILEINGNASLYLAVKDVYKSCNLYDVLHQDLHVEVKSIINDAENNSLLNKGSFEIFELDNEIVFLRLMVRKVMHEADGKEMFVLIFENLNPKGFTAKGINNGKLIDGLAFQQFAKRVLANAKSIV